jgi:hypothetical protein
LPKAVQIVSTSVDSKQPNTDIGIYPSTIGVTEDNQKITESANTGQSFMHKHRFGYELLVQRFQPGRAS